jgi:tRNA (guanine37-N1)-methyltransferase
VAVLVILEAVGRLLPGVLGNADSLVEESHVDGLLEAPVYTKPQVFRGLACRRCSARATTARSPVGGGPGAPADRPTPARPARCLPQQALDKRDRPSWLGVVFSPAPTIWQSSGVAVWPVLTRAYDQPPTTHARGVP